MVATCTVIGCHERANPESPITFHSFPKDEERRKQWLLKIGRENLKLGNYAKICSKHFTRDSFDRRRFGGSWLKNDAIPTLFDFSSQPETESQKETEEKAPDETKFDEPMKPLIDPRFLPQKRKFYLGDFNEEDMHSPPKAREVLQIAKCQTANLTRKLRDLNRRNKCLEEKFCSLQEAIKKPKKQSFISPSAKDITENSETVGNEGKEESPIQPTVQIEEKNPSPVEPTVKIKEEPADDYPTPSTSKDTPGGEFILPDESDSWTSSASVVEPQFTLSVASLALPNEPETSAGGEQPKEKQRTNSSDLTTPVSTPNDTKVEPQTTVHNLEEKSNPETSKDNLDAFGEYVVTRLRRFDQVLSSCTKAAIRNVLLQAEMSTYLNQTKDANS